MVEPIISLIVISFLFFHISLRCNKYYNNKYYNNNNNNNIIDFSLIIVHIYIFYC